MPIPISRLPASTNPPNTADLLPIVQNGKTKQTTLGALFTQLASFVQSGNGRTRTAQDKMREIVSVADMIGWNGDGVNDDSTAWANAISALGSAGGTIYKPRGKSLANITITQSNIRILGEGWSNNRAVVDDNYIAPFNVANPCITIGDDSKAIYDITLECLNIYGGATNSSAGAVGVKIAGGSNNVFLRDVAISHCTTNQLLISKGTTYAIAFVHINGFKTQPNGTANASAVQIQIDGRTTSPAVAGIFISDFNLEGAGVGGGYIMQVDAMQPLVMANGWIQVGANNGGVKLTNGSYIVGGDVAIDSPSSTDNLVEVDVATAADKHWAKWFKGQFNIDGLMKFSDASTLARIPTSHSHFSSGVVFPNTAINDASLLEWYEEGTFTATIEGSGTAGAGTYTAQEAIFVRVGRVVTFAINLAWSAHTGTGNMVLAGFPYTSFSFAANGAFPFVASYSSVSLGASNIPVIRMQNGGSKASFFTYADAGALTALALDTSAAVTVNGTYIVAEGN